MLSYLSIRYAWSRSPGFREREVQDRFEFRADFVGDREYRERVPFCVGDLPALRKPLRSLREVFHGHFELNFGEYVLYSVCRPYAILR